LAIGDRYHRHRKPGCLCSNFLEVDRGEHCDVSVGTLLLAFVIGGGYSLSIGLPPLSGFVGKALLLESTCRIAKQPVDANKVKHQRVGRGSIKIPTQVFWLMMKKISWKCLL
jgi:hypothetical protein